MSFSDYLQNRQQAFTNITDSLKSEVNTQKTSDDDRIWKAKLNKDGTGYAVVRFLPGKDLNKTPWIRIYDHGFQSPETGKWYIEKSLTTIGQQDPVSEYNSKLWNSGIESNKEIARKQKRRTSYYANVLVLKDPENPQNEGQVKIFRFGQKIFEKLMAAMQPEFADESPINPFDIIEGANFRIKMKTVSGYPNYDSSDFEQPSPLSDDESKMEAIFNAQHDVHAMIDPSEFKSYDDLQNRLNEVLGLTGGAQPVAQAPAPAEPKSIPTAETTSTGEEFGAVFDAPQKESSSDDDDLESYFKSLAN